VPSARLSWTGVGRADFGWLVPLAGLAGVWPPQLAGGVGETTGPLRPPPSGRPPPRGGAPGGGGVPHPPRPPPCGRGPRRARPFVERAAVLAIVFFERGDGAGDERIIVGHRTYSFRLQDYA